MTGPAARKPGSEADFQRYVTGLASCYGWLYYHAPDNMPRQTRGGRTRRQKITPGFPDLVLVRKPELIIAELKTEHGRLSPAQQQWLEQLQGIAAAITNHLDLPIETDGFAQPSVEVYVWRPADYDRIAERLSRGRHRLPSINRPVGAPPVPAFDDDLPPAEAA